MWPQLPDVGSKTRTGIPSLAGAPALVAIGLSLLLSTLAKPASAATVSWLAAVDGNWNDGTKWSGGSPPGPTDDAQITVTGAAFTVTLDVSPSVKSLQLGNTTGSQTLLASGQTLTVSDSVGVATTGRLALRSGSSIAGNLTNAGTVVANGSSNSVTGTYKSSAGSTLQVQCANVFANAQLTMANGFTNRGLIELSGTVNFFLGARLTVTNGTLTNAGTGTITSLESGGGPRVIDAQLNNQGAINVSWPLDVPKANAAHLNSGSITLDNTTNGVLTVTQSPSGSFTNQQGATYTLNSGTSLVFDNGTLHYDPVTTTDTGQVVVKNCTVVGVTLASTSAPFVLRANNTVDNINNAGTVIAQGNPNAVSGTYTSSAGSTLRIQCANVFANAQLTMANGFTNRGLIELSGTVNFFLGAQLTVSNATLTNASTGTISSLESGGGPRVIDAQLNNQGAINVSWPLDVTKANAAHLNSGSITLDNTTNGVLTFTQSPAGSFSNQAGATYTLNSGTSLVFDNGTLHYDPVTTSGTGEVVVKNCTVVGVTLASTSAPFVLRGNNTVDNITNAGTMVAQGNPNTVTDTYTSSVGSTLRVQCAAVFANAQLTVTNGFTNRGLIEFTGAVNFFLGGRLTVTNGTLTNASTGIIRSLFGGAGGDHVVQGVVSNFGVLECADWPLQFAGGPVTNQPSGTVRGGNTLDVTGVTYVDNGSTRPGSSPGILTIQPNDTRGVTSALHIEIGGYTPGTSYDRLNVPGQVDLNGTLNISLIDGFVPSLGDSFAIVTAGTRSGEFSILSGIQITPTLAFQVKYKPDRVDLIAGVPPPDNAPIARDDQATTGEDHSVDIDVLANDSDPDKDAIHVVAGNFFGPFNGVVNFKDPGMEFVRYVPNSDFFGPDSFKYVITDNRGGQDTAVVRVTVTPLNDPPFFSAPPTRADTARVKIGFKKQLSFSVVSNDIDPGALVTLTSGPLPAGVSMFPPLPVMGHPAFSTLSWSPLREQMGFHYVDFLATDDSLATHRITVEIEVTDNPTSTTLAEFTATPGSEGIELAWRIADPGDFARLTLERADGPQGPWTALDIDGRAESGSLMDRGVAAGRDYFYRISGSAGGGTVVLGTIHTRTEPAVFALSSITPSPTRGKATRIAYALPRASNVRISVCDIQGREVAVVERGARNAGRHEVVWSNESADHPLPAGLYFVRLEAMGMRSIKRVILAP